MNKNTWLILILLGLLLANMGIVWQNNTITEKSRTRLYEVVNAVYQKCFDSEQDL